MENTSQKPKVTPKDFFLWLGSMVALYISATALILLIHEYINVWFPSEFDRYSYDPYSGPIRFAIASLVVVFPLYIWLTRLLHQDIRRQPEKRELWVRRWLVFITLFIAGATMAGDLIALINTYLNGELTTRFALKALTIFVVLGGGFWYYLEELRGRWEAKEGQSKMIGSVVTILVLASVVGGFFIIGSPQSQRFLRFDEQKVSDLQTIQWQIVNYWQQKERLPASLAELQDPIGGFIVPTDPQTGEAYAYRIVAEPRSFELCADFNVPSNSLTVKDRAVAPMPTSEYVGGSLDNWQHGGEGETCFERTIDPDLYPPIKK